jgi:hypothetical protein
MNTVPSSERPLVETYSMGEEAYRIDCHVYTRRAEPAVAAAAVETDAEDHCKYYRRYKTLVTKFYRLAKED